MSLVCLYTFSSTFQSPSLSGALASGVTSFSKLANGWNQLVGPSGHLGVLSHPIYQSFTKNNPYIENNENKLNKIGLLQNPIAIGTRLCKTSMQTLRSVSRWLFMVLHIFLACRVPWVSPMATGVTINH